MGNELISEAGEIDCIVLSGNTIISPKTMTTMLFCNNNEEIVIKISPKSHDSAQTLVLTQLVTSDNLQVILYDEKEEIVLSESKIKHHQLILSWEGNKWEVKPVESDVGKKENFSTSSMRFIAAMSKCSRLLNLDDTLEFKRGYFITQHAGVLDTSHILSGFNDTLKYLRQLRKHSGSEFVVKDLDKWHVLGRDGFKFNVFYYVNELEKTAVNHALTITLFRHYIWEILQSLPEVSGKVGKMSEISSFAADDLISVYIGVLIAQKLVGEMGEDVWKNNQFLKIRRHSFEEILSKIGFVSPMNKEVQIKFYDIVRKMASVRVIDPNKPLVWSSEYRENALKEVIKEIEYDFRLIPFIKLEKID